MLCVAMAGALPQQQGYSTGGQYVGGPAQPQAPALGHPGTAGHPQGAPGPGQVIGANPAQGQVHHQPGPNEASLAELISFD